VGGEAKMREEKRREDERRGDEERQEEKMIGERGERREKKI
jgi:hypothetical protein